MRLFPMFVSLIGVVAVLSGASTQNPGVVIPRATKPPRIQDYVAESADHEGLRVSEFRQRQPLDGSPASLATTAFLSYDNNNLYVVFVCRDDPAKVRASMSRRESIDGDDTVSVALDTFHDGRRAYMFYANPKGVQLDGVSVEGQPDNYAFDLVWSADGRIFRNGYVVRFEIPFASIRRVSGNDAEWGIALTRYIPRNNEYATWPRITDSVEEYVPQFAAIRAPQPMSRERRLLLNPYGYAASHRFVNSRAQGMQMVAHRELRAGLDAKAQLGRSLTLDATLNPDFSQVESDEPQVTVNRRYEVYFPERRPFFLENAAHFQTPEQLFFSRRIADPEFGLRLSGRVGSWELGVLATDDRGAGTDESDSSRAGVAVVRVSKAIGSGSSIGGLATTRATSAGTNHVGSLDFRWKANRNWVFTGQAAYSNTSTGREEHRGSGFAGEARYVARSIQNYTTYRDRSADLDVPLGFIPRVDLRQVENDFSYRWRPETGVLTSFGPSLFTSATYDHRGSLRDWTIRLPFWFRFAGATTAYVARRENFEVFRGAGLRSQATEVYASSDKLKRFGVTAYAAFGSGINYHPVASVRSPVLKTTEVSFETTIRPGSAVRVDGTYYYTRAALADATAFSNHLVRLKVAFQLSRRLSLRTIVDYAGTLPDRNLVALERQKQLRNDVLFSYLVTPGTALHWGYSDSRENLTVPWQTSHGGGAPLFETGRQVFVKVSYAFGL